MYHDAAVQIEEVPCESCRQGFRRAVGDTEYLCPSCRQRMRINIGEGTAADEHAAAAAAEPTTYKAPHTTHPLECEACGRLFTYDSPNVVNDRVHDYGFCPCGGIIFHR